jgi:hypothetical protein
VLGIIANTIHSFDLIYFVEVSSSETQGNPLEKLVEILNERSEERKFIFSSANMGSGFWGAAIYNTKLVAVV